MRALADVCSRRMPAPSPRKKPLTGLVRHASIVWSRQKRVTGIEPVITAWEAVVLPLHYTREVNVVPKRTGVVSAPSFFRAWNLP